MTGRLRDRTSSIFFETNEQMTYMGLSSSEGSFIFTNSILNSNGEAVGIMEVGTDLYELPAGQLENGQEVMTTSHGGSGGYHDPHCVGNS